MPGGGGGGRRHGSRRRVRAGTQILFPDAPVLVDDERHDPGHVVRRGPGDEREASGHVAVDDVLLCPAGGGRSLRGQDLEVVAVEWRGLVALGRALTSGDGRVCEEVSKRAALLALRRRPVEAVLLARIAAERR